MEDDELTFVEFMIRAKRSQVANTIHLYEHDAMTEEVFRELFSRDVGQLDMLHMRAEALTQRRQCIDASGDSTCQPIAECLQSPNCSLRFRHGQDQSSNPDLHPDPPPLVHQSSPSLPSGTRSGPTLPVVSNLATSPPNARNSYDWLLHDVKPSVVEGGTVDKFIETLLQEAGRSSFDQPGGTSDVNVSERPIERDSCRSAGKTSDCSLGRDTYYSVGSGERSRTSIGRDVTEQDPRSRNGINSGISIGHSRGSSSISFYKDRSLSGRSVNDDGKSSRLDRDSSTRMIPSTDASNRSSRETATSPFPADTLRNPRMCISDGGFDKNNYLKLAAKRKTLFRNLDEIQGMIVNVTNLSRDNHSDDNRTPRVMDYHDEYRDLTPVREQTTVANSQNLSQLDSQKPSLFETNTTVNNSKHSSNSIKTDNIATEQHLPRDSEMQASTNLELARVGIVDNNIPGGYLVRLFRDLDDTKRVIRRLEALISCGSPLEAKHLRLVARARRCPSVDIGMLARHRATVACRGDDTGSGESKITSKREAKDRDGSLGGCTSNKSGLQANRVSFSRRDDVQLQPERCDLEGKRVDLDCVDRSNISFSRLGPLRSAVKAEFGPERGGRVYRKDYQSPGGGFEEKGRNFSGKWNWKDEEMLMKKNMETIKSRASLRREVESLEMELAGIRMNVESNESESEYSDYLSTNTLIPDEVNIAVKKKDVLARTKEDENVERSRINKSKCRISNWFGDGGCSNDDSSTGTTTENARTSERGKKFKVERYLLAKGILETSGREVASAERSRRRIWFGDKVLVASSAAGSNKTYVGDVLVETDRSRRDSIGTDAAEEEEAGNASGKIEIEQLYMNEKAAYFNDDDLINLE